MLPPILSEGFAAVAALLIAAVALFGEAITRHARLYRMVREGMRERASTFGAECQRATLPAKGDRTFLARLEEFSVPSPWFFWQYHRLLRWLKIPWTWPYRFNPNGTHVWPEDPELYNTLQLRLAAGGPARRARKEMGKRFPFPLATCGVCGLADLDHHNYRVAAANALWHLARLRTYQYWRRASLVALTFFNLGWIGSIVLRAMLP